MGRKYTAVYTENNKGRVLTRSARQGVCPIFLFDSPLFCSIVIDVIVSNRYPVVGVDLQKPQYESSKYSRCCHTWNVSLPGFPRYDFRVFEFATFEPSFEEWREILKRNHSGRTPAALFRPLFSNPILSEGIGNIDL